MSTALIKAQTATGLKPPADLVMRECPKRDPIISQEMAHSVDTSKRLYSLINAIITTK